MRSKPVFAITVLSWVCSGFALAESASIKVSDVSTSEDTSIFIKKGAQPSDSKQPVYEIVSGSDDVFGDPEAGIKESYASWKSACESWKKEFKELNKGNQIISVNCNQPTANKQANGTQIHQSTATYKMKVLIRGNPHAAPIAPAAAIAPEKTESDPKSSPSSN